jgi:hypothetical protein
MNASYYRNASKNMLELNQNRKEKKAQSNSISKMGSKSKHYHVYKERCF